MAKDRRLVIFGDSAFAEVAFEYFQHDSPYEVVAFAVSREYRKRDTLFDRPVIDFEEVAARFPPDRCEMFVALVYNQLNRVRRRFYDEARALGYRLASYVSPRAFVWRNVRMGDNCFVFEDNVIQPFVELGSNLILWSGNHIGHHSRLASHSFFASHVVISGFVEVGEACFFGVNAAVANNLTIGADCLVGAGALVTRSLPAGSLVKGRACTPEEETTWKRFGVPPP